MRCSFSNISAFVLLIFVSSPGFADWLSGEEAIMGTEVKVTLWQGKGVKGEQAIAAVMKEMRRIDQTYSPYIETSDLAQLNTKGAKAPMPVSKEMLFLLDKSLFYSRLTKGAFDVTYASVGWHYNYREKKQPNKQQTKTLLPAINYQHIVVDKKEQKVHFNHNNVRVDLGGIAKGYAVDRSIEILKKFQVKHASISAGGDSRLLGDKRGRPWLIGIKNPRALKGLKVEAVLTMPLNNVAISTSGDYERYFIDQQSGKRVHHIINPKTGESASGVVSVSILGPLSVDADALSTSVFVLGVKEGLKLIDGLQDFDCVIIDNRGVMHYSSGLQEPER